MRASEPMFRTSLNHVNLRKKSKSMRNTNWMNMREMRHSSEPERNGMWDDGIEMGRRQPFQMERAQFRNSSSIANRRPMSSNAVERDNIRVLKLHRKQRRYHRTHMSEPSTNFSISRTTTAAGLRLESAPILIRGMYIKIMNECLYFASSSILLEFYVIFFLLSMRSASDS